ncbi:MAG: glutamate--tRNA ligase [Spirochaetaceae bacterium]|jgi:glutamyl-tRNA synthetase|nr:glutamate--tRNA ligase [Spirochaetaceae bacterium]
MKIKDRYAPSPTGLQHIGGVRTALFNYLFARSAGGTFILRLEDTDRARFDEAFVQNLYDTFRWLGLSWDEGPDVGGPSGPYIQSERFGLYKRYAQELVDAGKGYYCFCSADRLEAVRKAREAARSSLTGYDRQCRSLSPEEAVRRAAAGEPYVIRLKIPLGETTSFSDRLLGDVTWKNDDLSPDPVLLKSDGFPTYHLANVADDHCMGITHVLRAQEWLPSTPLHSILYRSFGWDPPVFCHLPMVMGQDGKKLSKRHGATSIDEFRRQGYLPEALLNYVALLGASYEEGKVLYTLQELSGLFSLEKLNKAPAVFDYKKLEWYNGQYIRMKSGEELAELALPFAVERGLFGAPGTDPQDAQREDFIKAMPLIKERVSFLREIPDKLGYLFSEPRIPDRAEFIPKKADLPKTAALLKLGRALIGTLAELDDLEAEQFVKASAEKAGVSLGDLMTPLRTALTGSRVSPPLFGSVRILGAKRSLERVDRALSFLEAEAKTS